MGRYSTRRKLRGFPTFRDFPSCAAIELDRSFVSRAHDRGVVTANTPEPKEIGGEGIRVHDSYV
jgi:hypothetical protein